MSTETDSIFIPTVELCKKNEYFKLLVGVTEKEFLLQRNKFIIEADKPVDGNVLYLLLYLVFIFRVI